MRDTIKRIMAIVVAAVMILLVILQVFAFSVSAKTSISQKQNTLSETQKKKNSINQQISQVKNQKEDTMAKKKALDSQVSALNASIDKLDTDIATKENEITSKENEITTLTTQIDENNAKFRTRVRVMYEKGDTSYIEVILNSKSFSDMFTRIELVREMASHDKNLLNDLNNSKAKLVEVKTSLEADKTALENDKVQLDSQKAEAEKKANEADALMAELNSKQEDLKAQEEKMAAEEEAVRKEIAQMQAEQAASKSAATSSAGGGSTTPAAAGGRLGWPSAVSRTVSCPFGMRVHPVTGVYKLHTGMDISAPRGSNVLAAEAGTVVRATYSAAYGNYIVINHGNGISTLYGHNTSLCVSVGQKVTRGQVIAKVGSTGYATGPHIHIEVIVNGQYQNPANYLY